MILDTAWNLQVREIGFQYTKVFVVVLKRLCQKNKTHSTYKKFRILCCYQFMGRNTANLLTKYFQSLTNIF